MKMKYISKSVGAAILLSLFCFSSFPLLAQEDLPGLADYLPPNAVVYLESKELSSQLSSLLDSDFAGKFVKTQAYKDFTISKLYNKIKDRISNLESATDFGLNLKNLRALAGAGSAFALYDIGELKFVFITKIGPEKVMASSLWGLKEKFEIRRITDLNLDYYVKEENGGRVSFAFALHKGYLVAGTDIVNFEKTLALFENPQGSLGGSDNFKSAFPADKSFDDIVIYLDLKKITATPYWKSYWVYRNQEELKAFPSAVISLKILPGTLVERRYFPIQKASVKKATGFANLMSSLPGAMDYYEFGLLEPKGTREQLEGLFSEIPAKQINSLSDVLISAKPGKYCSAMRMQHYTFDSLNSEKTIGIELANISNADADKFKRKIASLDRFNLEKIVVIELADISKFDVNKFERRIAAIFENKFLYGEEGVFEFKEESGFKLLEIPLLDSIRVGYKLADNRLFIFRGLMYLNVSPGAVTNNGLMYLASGEGNIAGFWLEYAAGSKKLMGYFDLLAKRKNWSSTNNAKFFDVSFSSLLKSLDGIDTVTRTAKEENQFLVEEIVYLMSSGS